MTFRKNLKSPKKARSTSKKNKRPIKNSQKSKNRMKKKSQKKKIGGSKREIGSDECQKLELSTDLNNLEQLQQQINELQQPILSKLCQHLDMIVNKTSGTDGPTSPVEIKDNYDKVTNILLRQPDCVDHDFKLLEQIKNLIPERTYHQYLMDNFEYNTVSHTPVGTPKRRKLFSLNNPPSPEDTSSVMPQSTVLSPSMVSEKSP